MVNARRRGRWAKSTPHAQVGDEHLAKLSADEQ
jgi:hypothetical protein